MNDSDHRSLERRTPGRPDRRSLTTGNAPATGRRAADYPLFGVRQLRQLEMSPCPMRIFDHATLRYLAVNDAALQLYGYGRAEFLKLTVHETRHPNEYSSLLAAVSERTGYLTHRAARRQVKRSGEIFLADVVTQDVRFEGRAARLCLTIDISERVRMQELLRDREQLFAALVVHSPDIISRLDRGFRHIYVSPAVTAAMGRPPEDFIGKTISEVGLPPGLAARWDEVLREAFATGSEQSIECTYEGLEGPRHFESRLVPEKTASGGVNTMLVITRDITHRKTMEDALRDSEERFRQLAENIEEVFWIKDPIGDSCAYVSPAYEKIWGRTCDSVRRDPKSWLELVHPEDLPAVHDAVKRMPRAEPTDVEYRIVRADGTTRWIRDRSYPMRRGDGTRLTCGIAEDITGQKRSEQERLAHALHQRDALVREVHHRIKNHLQGIAGLLRDKAGNNPAAANTIDAAVGQLQAVAVVYGLHSELAESGVPLSRVLEAICASAEGLGLARVTRGFVADKGAVRLAEAEAVPVAVALNELVFNAIEHGAHGDGKPAVEVSLAEGRRGADIRIVNRGRLPARFDYAQGVGTGTGLDLVRTLLGPCGNRLAFAAREGMVHVQLSLGPPLVSGYQRKAKARSR